MSNKIRVLQLGSPTGLYGAERWILALVRHLDPTKVESFVGVIKDAPDLECPLIREAAALGMHTCIFESYGRISFTAVKQLREFIRKQKIDILHTHYYKTDLIGFLATKGTKCKIISTPHGWTQKPDFKLYLYEFLDRCLFPFMDGVVPLSDEMAKPLRSIPFLKRKLHVVKNGVDLKEIDSDATILPVLQKWKREGYFIIGYIGRLVNGKGLDILLQAVSQLESVKWKLIIVGEGDDELFKTMVDKLSIGKSVFFYGYQEKRIQYLRGFDVFVLPSRSEGTPRSVMEAMAARIPVVVSDIEGCRNLITDNHTGLLFSVDSVDDLVVKILSVINDLSLINKLVSNSRLEIEKKFSAERMAVEYEYIYLKI
jgi:glycosyltransferase involved in cell wall biosynthesis